MKELESYIQSVDICSGSLIRGVWSDRDECSMVSPEREVEGLDATPTSFYHGAMARYETRGLQQDDVKIQEFYDVTIICFYWILYAAMKDNGGYITSKGRGVQIYRSYLQGKRLVHVYYSRLP